jgi:Cu/Ag efflux pump CusA
VATAIVWGLAFSTILTLIVIPLLYRLFMSRSHLNGARVPEQHDELQTRV